MGDQVKGAAQLDVYAPERRVIARVPQVPIRLGTFRYELPFAHGNHGLVEIYLMTVSPEEVKQQLADRLLIRQTKPTQRLQLIREGGQFAVGIGCPLVQPLLETGEDLGISRLKKVDDQAKPRVRAKRAPES